MIDGPEIKPATQENARKAVANRNYDALIQKEK